MTWLDTVAERTSQSGPLVRIVIARADGSTPRDSGAAMLVTPSRIEGTIGGGALELEAIGAARAMLASSRPEAVWTRETRDYPLGPSLGQCCGGYAKLLFERFSNAEFCSLGDRLRSAAEGGLAVRPLESGTPIRILARRKDGYSELPLNVLRATRDILSGARPATPAFFPASKGAPAWFVEPLQQKRTALYLYGAGHVGRALVRVLEGLPFDIVWVDTSEDRFPAFDAAREDVRRIATADPAEVAARAEDGAFHIVMTYSHPLDLALCHAALRAGNFAFLGLIGSQTKRVRFLKRLRELGHPESALARLTCPIGIAGLRGKEPAVIAVSVAAQLLQMTAAGGLATLTPETIEAAQ